MKPSNLEPPTSNLLICIALSGFCALAAEVVWTRMLSLIFGATVYTFSIILSVFLIGLGIGSGIGSAVSKRVARPAIALGWCQWLTVGAMLWSAEILARSLPYWPASGHRQVLLRTFEFDLARALWAILPAPILWGASFPLALAAARSAAEAGRCVRQCHIVGMSMPRTRSERSSAR